MAGGEEKTITGQSMVFSTPWSDVVSKTVEEGMAPCYSLSLDDYLCNGLPLIGNLTPIPVGYKTRAGSLQRKD